MWVSHGGERGDGPPTPEQLEQWRRRISPPDNELPADVGLSLLLGRTDDAAAAITHVEAFSTGFRFTLAVRLRQARQEFAFGGLSMLIGSHRHPGIDVPLESRLLLGIEYADGQRASTLQDVRLPSPGADDDEQRLMLTQQGGSSDGRSADQAYWVCPLPPEGPVTFVLAWPGFGMPETRVDLDGDAIRAAAARSQVLWPPQPFAAPPAPATATSPVHGMVRSTA